MKKIILPEDKKERKEWIEKRKKEFKEQVGTFLKMLPASAKVAAGFPFYSKKEGMFVVFTRTGSIKTKFGEYSYDMASRLGSIVCNEMKGSLKIQCKTRRCWRKKRIIFKMTLMTDDPSKNFNDEFIKIRDMLAIMLPEESK